MAGGFLYSPARMKQRLKSQQCVHIIGTAHRCDKVRSLCEASVAFSRRASSSSFLGPNGEFSTVSILVMQQAVSDNTLCLQGRQPLPVCWQGEQPLPVWQLVPHDEL